jgi:enoyl-[acyl-carrier protein] reductase II
MSKPTFCNSVNIKWPIAIMAMNRVSDVNLAVAGANAGILPSLSIFNYYTGPGQLDVDKATAAIIEYNLKTNNAPLLLSIGVDTLVVDEAYNMLIVTNVKVVELLLDSPAENVITEKRNNIRNMRIAELRSRGVIVLQKALNIADIEEVEVDGFILKGPDAAGRVINDGDTLLDRIRKCKERYPEKYVVANGGVGNSAQLKECLEAGADAVGLGTIFAASAECSISTETKLKMVSATAQDVHALKGGAKQHALIFKELTKDVHNNTHGLTAGIKSPTVGHVFVGKGIEHINGIKPVQQIVDELTKDLI